MTRPRLAEQLNGCSVLPPDRPEVKASQNNKRRKTAGRFGVLNAFLDFTSRNFGRAEILVWLLLYRDTKPNGLASTSQADLARRAGITTRTVERAICRLEEHELIEVVRRGGIGRGPSTYRVYPLAGATTNPTPVSGHNPTFPSISRRHRCRISHKGPETRPR